MICNRFSIPIMRTRLDGMDLTNDGVINLTYYRSEDQITDILIKPLKFPAFQKLMMLLDIQDMVSYLYTLVACNDPIYSHGKFSIF
ncbi:hypothetical protein Lal_00033269 [Lupinus albus]|nr:hypothetical protein Lal_00033269 [Lupinus albus]